MAENQEILSRLKAAMLVLDSVPEYPAGFSGRGCIICGGGRYAVCAFVTASELRHYGWPYPIEIWHLGPAEMDAGLRRAFEDLEVICVDAWEYLLGSPMKCFGGWESKVFSVLKSRFEEVLFLDADSIPARNPDILFRSDGYLKTGAVFWPDLERYRRDAGQARWPVFGVPYRDVPEWETGQFLVDKRRCWKALQLAQHYNSNSDYYYQFVHGDKDCIHLAWLKSGSVFSLMPPTEPREWGLRQFDSSGNLVFQHRTLAKYRFDETAAYPDFENEERCLAHIRCLQQQWKGFSPLRLADDRGIHAGAPQLHGKYVYAPADGLPITIALMEDGSISASGPVPWTSWRSLGDDSGCTGLSLHAADGWYCPAPWNGVCFAGRWPMPWMAGFVLLRVEGR